MENKNNFPIQQNTTYIPEGFLCFAVDLESKPHPALKFINCNAIIAVESPSGWKIHRCKRSRFVVYWAYPFHRLSFFKEAFK